MVRPRGNQLRITRGASLRQGRINSGQALSGGPPAPSGPINTVAPVASGTPNPGQTLTSTNGTWTGTGVITYAYQWQADAVDIPSATANTYLLTASELDKAVRCVVTATDDVGSTAANSNTLDVVASPIITENLQHLWDGALGITKDVSDAILQWDDQVGSADFVQVTGTKQPLWIASLQNSLPGVQFDGINDSIAEIVANISAPWTLFIVAKMVAWGSTDYILDVNSDLPAFYMAGASPNINFYDGTSINNNTATVGQMFLGTLLENGASSSSRINEETPATGSHGANALTAITLGDYTGVGFYGNVEFCEIAAYSGAMSSGDQTIMRNYFNNKYALWA